MQTAPPSAPSAVDALIPRPILPLPYWLGRVIGWAVASVAGAHAADHALVVAAPK